MPSASQIFVPFRNLTSAFTKFKTMSVQFTELFAAIIYKTFESFHRFHMQIQSQTFSCGNKPSILMH